MRGCPGTTRLGLLLRLLIVVGCLLPFVVVRPGAIGLRLVQFPGLPVTPLPTAPVEEEEHHQSTKELVSHTAGRHPDRPRSSTRGQPLLTTSYPSGTAAVALSRSAPADPFRNGLGSPYRC